MMEYDYIKQGACLELMRDIPDGSVNMILCDLPYGVTGSKWDKVIDMDALWAQYKRVISDNGAIVLFGTEPFCTMMRAGNLQMYKYDWIWKKSDVTGFAHAKNMPMRDYENIMVFSKGKVNHQSRTNNRMAYNPQGLRPYGKKRTVGCSSSVLVSNLGSYIKEQTGYPRMVLQFPLSKEDRGHHVNAKPVALLEYLIRTYTNEGKVMT